LQQYITANCEEKGDSKYKYQVKQNTVRQATHRQLTVNIFNCSNRS